MFDPAWNVLIALLVVQGLKAIGLPVSDTTAKVVSLLVAALFFFANGIIATFLPKDLQIVAQQVVDAIKAILMLFAPAGAYSFVKSFRGG